MHALCPLKGNHRALDRLDHREGQDDGNERPDDRLPIDGDGKDRVDGDHRTDDHMAQDQDDDIGREVMRLMPFEIFPAMGAGSRGSEEGREQLSFTAGRAAALQAMDQSWANQPFILTGEIDGRSHAREIGLVRDRGNVFCHLCGFGRSYLQLCVAQLPLCCQ